jgi:hypothetical protein
MLTISMEFSLENTDEVGSELPNYIPRKKGSANGWDSDYNEWSLSCFSLVSLDSNIARQTYCPD